MQYKMKVLEEGESALGRKEGDKQMEEKLGIRLAKRDEIYFNTIGVIGEKEEEEGIDREEERKRKKELEELERK